MPIGCIHNKGDGTFEEVASQEGMEQVERITGASWADYDGDLDLYAGNVDGPDRLFKNAGGTNQVLTIAESIPALEIVQRISFGQNTGSHVDIQLMDSDGGNVVRLTNNSTFDSYQAWSPDGTKIVFTSFRDGNYELYLMDADGSNLTRLTTNLASDTFPSWSPDGSKIIYASNANIQTIAPDGTGIVQLTTTGMDGDASYSPDGTKILFQSDRDGNTEIYVMDADGSNATRLTNNSVSDFGARWSVDGQRIVFGTRRDGSDDEIYVMDADGSNQTALTNNSTFDGRLSWSDAVRQIGVVSVGGTVSRLLTIKNRGAGGLSVSNITSSDGQFTISPTSFAIASSGSQNVTITFNPTSAGTQYSTLTISSNDPDIPSAKLIINGAVLNEIIERDYQIRSIIDVPNDQGRQVRVTWNKHLNDSFGADTLVTEYSVWRMMDPDLPTVRAKIVPDSTGTPEGRWDFINKVIANQSDEYNAIVSTLADSTVNSGVYYSIFFIQAHTAFPNVLAPFYLRVSKRVSARVTFSPLRVGEFDGLIRIRDQDQELQLAGTGGAGPGIRILPATGRDFGEVEVGQVGRGALTVINEGQGPLRIFDLVANRLEYRVVQADSLPLTVAPGLDRPIEVEFTPLEAGAAPGRLTIVSNDPEQSELERTLDGQGIEVLQLDPDIFVSEDDIDFGLLDIGAAGEQTLLIQNRGAGLLRVERVEATSMQVQADPESLVVVTGDSRLVTLHLKPDSGEQSVGIVRVFSNDPDRPEIRRRWRYQRPVPVASLLTQQLRFGIEEGGQRSALLAVQNRGNAPLVVDLFDDTGELRFGEEGFELDSGEVARALVFYSGVGGSGDVRLATNDPLHPEVVIPWEAEANLLELLTAVPGDGAVEVDTDVTLDLIFNQNLRQAGRPTGGLVNLEARIFPNPLNNWRREMTVVGSEVRIPLQLEEGQTYRLVVVNARTHTGARLAAPFELSFSTGTTPVPTGGLAGAVQFEDGAPFVGTVFLANKARQLVGSTRVRQDGSYGFGGIPVGFYNLFVQEEGTELSFAREAGVQVGAGPTVADSIDISVPVQQQILDVTPIEEAVVIDETPQLLDDSTFVVPIRTDPVEDLTGFVVRLSFDPEAVALIDAAPEGPDEPDAVQRNGGFGLFLTRVIDEETLEYGGGLLGADEATAPDEGGLLAYLTFQALRTDAEVSIDFIQRRTLRGEDSVPGGRICPGCSCPCDFDGDGQVGFNDFFIFSDNFGKPVPPAPAIIDKDGDKRHCSLKPSA